MPSTASLTWRPRISATLCAIISPAPVAVLPPPAQGRLDRVAVLSEPGSTRPRHELAIGATDETCLVGLRQSLVRTVEGLMFKTSRDHVLHLTLRVAGTLLTCWAAAGPVHAAEAAMCRELERRFDQIRLDIGPIQLNSALFTAADTGCEGLAQKLLAA